MPVGVYGDQVLPRLIDKVLDNDDIRALRRQALDGISGVVLEIGFGSGLNVAMYPPEVTKVYAIDPATVGRKLAADRISKAAIPIEFIGLDGDVDGMVHMSDIAWGVSGEEALQLHRKGEGVKAQVLDVDVEKERISLGIKQLESGGGAAAAGGATRGGTAGAGGVKKGETLTVTVRAIQEAGLDVQVGDDGATGFIKRGDLGRDRDEQRAERFQVGQKLDAMVIGFDRSKKPNFSVKALQIAEEKQAVAQYGSSDSGASLGDILGAALKEAQAAKPTKKK
jgi:ribosomal protein S1